MNMDLTEREREVLRGLFDGQCHKQIASRLKLSIKTIGYYVNSIYLKTRSRNAVQSVRWGIEQGYLPEVRHLVTVNHGERIKCRDVNNCHRYQ